MEKRGRNPGKPERCRFWLKWNRHQVEHSVSGGPGVSRISHSRRSALGTAVPRVCDTFPQHPFVNHSTHETKNVDSGVLRIEGRKLLDTDAITPSDERFATKTIPIHLSRQ
ncbi:hypothetical protein Zmor_026015 [Zophobas morio]|uniref:Uncharacterized protein n=1 Tax=Zophobas morio TaxID=2755281 RepID=A0AA38HSN3_9CUCU|nr:hypothetical protein Zmor_026015 [Zophobas morio]